MLKEIIVAIQSYIEAHQFIRKHRLWKWILIPGVVYTVLFILGMYFFLQSANEMVHLISRETGLEAWLQRERNELLSFLFVLAGVFLWIILLLFYFSLFKFLFLILGSPAFAYLSEKTESILEGKDFPFSFPQFLRDVGRGVRLALRNTFWQSIYLLAIVLLSLIPIAGSVAPLIALVVECYYFGFSMLDYSLERNKLNFSQSIYFVGRHRGLAIGNGLIFYLMHSLVLVGWVVAPAYAVVAATLSLHKVKTS
ncbi:EI24 domain-containing protein [Paraflavisolibacter sp. H34]|uniref:EI24 domain-containing protein n=1 Tax=Huijunlia imazamoxiresistens TaxID=3127457 RepID=UPI00301588A8